MEAKDRLVTLQNMLTLGTASIERGLFLLPCFFNILETPEKDKQYFKDALTELYFTANRIGIYQVSGMAVRAYRQRVKNGK